MIQLKNELIVLNQKNEELEAENTRLKGTSKEPTESLKVQNLLCLRTTFTYIKLFAVIA